MDECEPLLGGVPVQYQNQQQQQQQQQPVQYHNQQPQQGGVGQVGLMQGATGMNTDGGLSNGMGSLTLHQQHGSASTRGANSEQQQQYSTSTAASAGAGGGTLDTLVSEDKLRTVFSLVSANNWEEVVGLIDSRAIGVDLADAEVRQHGTFPNRPISVYRRAGR